MFGVWPVLCGTYTEWLLPTTAGILPPYTKQVRQLLFVMISAPKPCHSSPGPWENTDEDPLCWGTKSPWITAGNEVWESQGPARCVFTMVRHTCVYSTHQISHGGCQNVQAGGRRSLGAHRLLSSPVQISSWLHWTQIPLTALQVLSSPSLFLRLQVRYLKLFPTLHTLNAAASEWKPVGCTQHALLTLFIFIFSWDENS